MFIHPYLAEQRHRDLIAAAETDRLADAARSRHPAWLRMRRITHPARRPAPLRSQLIDATALEFAGTIRIQP